MMTLVPARYITKSSWLLQPVTWKSGTEISVRGSAQPLVPRHRLQVSQFDRKFAWVVIAPLGKPVVPLV